MKKGHPPAQSRGSACQGVEVRADQTPQSIERLAIGVLRADQIHFPLRHLRLGLVDVELRERPEIQGHLVPFIGFLRQVHREL